MGGNWDRRWEAIDQKLSALDRTLGCLVERDLRRVPADMGKAQFGTDVEHPSAGSRSETYRAPNSPRT